MIEIAKEFYKTTSYNEKFSVEIEKGKKSEFDINRVLTKYFNSKKTEILIAYEDEIKKLKNRQVPNYEKIAQEKIMRRYSMTKTRLKKIIKYFQYNSKLLD